MGQFWQWFLDPANQKLLFTVVVGFILGLLVGRVVKARKERKAEALAKQGDKAFFKGIQYILSNDHDHAIEEFTKSVQINYDTIETYVALGNLYRSKGDIDRAMRIRQSIILRPNIDEQIKIRALFDLGLDYRKGGFLNRALDALTKVLQKEPANREALDAVERIHEEMKDWQNAFATRQKIARLDKGDHGPVLAHYQTEMGKMYQENGEFSKAKSCFQKAISIHEACVDAHLHLGDLYFARQDYKKAIAAWKKVVRVAPQFTFLAYRRLEGAYSKMKDLKPVEEFLKECAHSNADAFTHLALARYLHNKEDYDGALRELDNALELDPAFWEARKFKGEILLALGMREDALAAYGELIAHLHMPYLQFQCNNCGFRPPELQWQCPQCKKWDTIRLMDSAMVDSDKPSKQLQEPTTDLPEKSPEEEL
jgi:lipopolysaccharide biosynthesis regulator YciM